jgi:hypothetical protein
MGCFSVSYPLLTIPPFTFLIRIALEVVETILYSRNKSLTSVQHNKFCTFHICSSKIKRTHTHAKNVILLSFSNLFTPPIQYNTIQYNTIQYNTIQYNTIQLPVSSIYLSFHIHLQQSPLYTVPS